jgi:ATP-dependent DNA ligase
LIERSTWSEIIYAQHVEEHGRLLFQEVCERNLEGMVAKRRMGVYAEHGWLKIKNTKYTQARGGTTCSRRSGSAGRDYDGRKYGFHKRGVQ